MNKCQSCSKDLKASLIRKCFKCKKTTCITGKCGESILNKPFTEWVCHECKQPAVVA